MKKIFVFIVMLLVFNSKSISQIRFGAKFGASSQNLLTKPITINGHNDLADINLALQSANYGVHAGIFSQVSFLGLFLQPEVVLNSNNTTFQVEELGIKTLKKESYQHVDIPLLIGFKMGPLQVGAGPVGHVFLKSTSELFDLQGYSQKFKELTYGYQGSAALVLGKLYLNVRYEGNFSKLGDHINFFGNSFQFDKAPSRLIGSIAIAF